MSPQEACLDALKRVSRNFNDDMTRLAAIDLKFYVLREDGIYAGASLWDKPARNSPRGGTFAVNDSGENRLETAAWLYQR